MSLEFRILQLTDLEEVYEYERKRISESIVNETDRELASWGARWRREALEHYLPLGWSFLSRDSALPSSHPEGQLVGYFLAQPLLFFEGQTQSLWVEHLAYTSLQVRDSLCDLAYRLSREKHFQKVFFPNVSGVANSVAAFKPETWTPQALTIKTTKAI